MKANALRLCSIFLVISVLLCAASCSALGEYAAERAVVAELERDFDADGITVFDKYEVSDKEYYYFLRLSDADSSETELIAVYDASEKTAEIYGLAEMSEDVENKWDEIKNARADKSFSAREISEILNGD